MGAGRKSNVRRHRSTSGGSAVDIATGGTLLHRKQCFRSIMAICVTALFNERSGTVCTEFHAECSFSRPSLVHACLPWNHDGRGNCNCSCTCLVWTSAFFLEEVLRYLHLTFIHAVCTSAFLRPRLSSVASLGIVQMITLQASHFNEHRES